MTDQAEKQPFWEMMGLPAPGTPMTSTEFDQLPEVNFYVELIHGVLVYPHWDEDTMTAVPILSHQTIVLNVASWLKVWSGANGGITFVSPVDVWLTDAVRLQPDVMWLAPDSQCAPVEKHLKGAPELVVEVLSPSTARRDKTDKYDLYEMHGVHEYWIVDPRDKLMEVYVRDENTFRRLGGYKPEDTFQSPALSNHAVPVREFFTL